MRGDNEGREVHEKGRGVGMDLGRDGGGSGGESEEGDGKGEEKGRYGVTDVGY